MLKAALYARYSSDLQNPGSIDDQLRLCRELAEWQGWEIVGLYHDEAVSGASLQGRDGLQRLMEDGQARQFDIVCAEALDRISRDQEDMARIHKRLRFVGVALHTVSDGRVDELHVGFRGTMNALFLRDLAEKTHRGLRGRVEQGRSGGGLAYGYDVAADQGEGARQINEREAPVIRRIFKLFADGQSPGRIADALNAEDIYGPRNRFWSGTTIRGHRSRGTGIINNELYRGVLVWNRQRYLKDPQTGRRLARPNPPESWIRTEVPELRIVSDALWQAVQLRQDEIENRSRAIAEGVRIAAKAREHGLLPASSGLCRLLACGLCEGEIIHVGRQRYGCAAHARKKACDNRRTVERRVMDAEIRSVLEEAAATIMLHADPLEQETQAQGDLQERRMERERQELVVVDGRIQSVMTAIEDGLYTPALKTRMQQLEDRAARLRASLQIAGAHQRAVLTAPRRFTTQARKLIGALRERDDTETVLKLRRMIGPVAVTPAAGQSGLRFTLRARRVWEG